MKTLMLLAILACCMTVSSQAPIASAPASFWSLVRGESSLESIHMDTKTMEGLKAVLKQNKSPTLVMFGFASGPSNELRPYFEKQAAAKGVKALYFRVYNSNDVIDAYNLQKFPTFKLIDATGKELWSKSGNLESIVSEAVDYAKKNS